jgi:hypothetical protein
MYIKEILQYLLWPALIIITWFSVRAAITFFEKKFGDRDQDHAGS